MDPTPVAIVLRKSNNSKIEESAKDCISSVNKENKSLVFFVSKNSMSWLTNFLHNIPLMI